jgi:hypothetical protein
LDKLAVARPVVAVVVAQAAELLLRRATCLPNQQV